MALDVFLVVFHQYDAAALRKLELKYITVITTISFIPAFAFIFISTPDKGTLYGSVTVSYISLVEGGWEQEHEADSLTDLVCNRA
jgi:hypothetical protein